MSMANPLSTVVDFDLTTGLSKTRQPLQRQLSELKGLFSDDVAYQAH